jgi:hypothetical protein
MNQLLHHCYSRIKNMIERVRSTVVVNPSIDRWRVHLFEKIWMLVGNMPETKPRTQPFQSCTRWESCARSCVHAPHELAPSPIYKCEDA